MILLSSSRTLAVGVIRALSAHDVGSTYKTILLKEAES
jgi:hypothetical protein